MATAGVLIFAAFAGGAVYAAVDRLLRMCGLDEETADLAASSVASVVFVTILVGSVLV